MQSYRITLCPITAGGVIGLISDQQRSMANKMAYGYLVNFLCIFSYWFPLTCYSTRILYFLFRENHNKCKLQRQQQHGLNLPFFQKRTKNGQVHVELANRGNRVPTWRKLCKSVWFLHLTFMTIFNLFFLI